MASQITNNTLNIRLPNPRANDVFKNARVVNESPAVQRIVASSSPISSANNLALRFRLVPQHSIEQTIGFNLNLSGFKRVSDMRRQILQLQISQQEKNQALAKVNIWFKKKYHYA